MGLTPKPHQDQGQNRIPNPGKQATYIHSDATTRFDHGGCALNTIRQRDIIESRCGTPQTGSTTLKDRVVISREGASLPELDSIFFHIFDFPSLD